MVVQTHAAVSLTGANHYLKKDKDYFAMRDQCANFKLLESRRILPLVYPE